MKRALLFALTLSVCRAAPPVVSKVEPPDWVSPHRQTAVRLLLTGHDLGAAEVRACPFLSAGKARISADGDYLFVDISIPAGAAAGPCELHIHSAAGDTSAPFAITEPLSDGAQGFSPDDVIYLIMPDRFADGDTSNDDPVISRGLYDRNKPHYYHGGDLAGVRQKLPYLKTLGVTTIWLTPIFDNANRLNERERAQGQPITDYHGYGAVDFYRVDEHFGTLADYRGLVEAAHHLGMKVIQDEVANHTGPYHPWVTDPPTPAWFHGTEADHLNNTWQTWTLLDPHATPDLRRSTLDGWFANILPDLNQDDPEVARYLIQNSLWWIGRTGIDGIREDTVPYVPRTFWRDWTAAIHRDYPRVRVVGEVLDSDPALAAFYQGGRVNFDGVDTGIDSVFDYPMFYPLRRVFAHHASPVQLAQMAAHDSLYPNPSVLVTTLGTHDVARFMHEGGATVDDLARAFTFLFTFRGTPMIYYGDEIGMPGGDDPDNRRDFPGGWPGDARNAFEASGRTADENRLFDRVRRLADLRRQSDAMRHGKVIDLLATDRAYAFARVAGSDCVIAIFHEGSSDETLRIAVAGVGLPDGVWLSDVLGGIPPIQASKGTIDVRLPKRTAAVLVARPSSR